MCLRNWKSMAVTPGHQHLATIVFNTNSVKHLRLLASIQEPQLGIGRAARGVLVVRHGWNSLRGKLAFLAGLG